MCVTYVCIKKQRTRLNETKVNVEAIWIECSELENRPHLLILSPAVITATAYETTDPDVIK